MSLTTDEYMDLYLAVYELELAALSYGIYKGGRVDSSKQKQELATARTKVFNLLNDYAFGIKEV